mmetsp:Transcript_119410/g.207316  ORF Transcript_119410/g.207316 Transcript_119410/m.207316 type:complete len:250 (-) Transcript_119410:112-861(-)
MNRFCRSLLTTTVLATFSGTGALSHSIAEEEEVCLADKCQHGRGLLQVGSERHPHPKAKASEKQGVHRLSAARRSHMCMCDEWPKHKSIHEHAAKKVVKASLSEVADKAVQRIDLPTLESKMRDVDSAFLIVFYVDWCHHCQRFVGQSSTEKDAGTPPLEKVGKDIKSADGPPVYKFLMEDGGEDAEEPPPEFEIQGYPTIYLKKKGSKMPVEYPGNYEGTDGLHDLKVWTMRNWNRASRSEDADEDYD